ncbi:MAG: hypothetical protein IKZ88_00455 [Neisseriaceae bacterium]|nr:hypothetical protein [Neisseriaceae bacterium]
MPRRAFGTARNDDLGFRLPEKNRNPKKIFPFLFQKYNNYHHFEFLLSNRHNALQFIDLYQCRYFFYP